MEAVFGAGRYCEWIIQTLRKIEAIWKRAYLCRIPHRLFYWRLHREANIDQENPNGASANSKRTENYGMQINNGIVKYVSKYNIICMGADFRNSKNVNPPKYC